jgi:hypothetical protein
MLLLTDAVDDGDPMTRHDDGWRRCLAAAAKRGNFDADADDAVVIEFVVPKACTTAKVGPDGDGPSKRERRRRTDSGNLTRGAIDDSDGRLGLPRRRLACLSSNEKGRGQEGRRADPGAAASAAESAVGVSAPRIVGRKSRKRVG